MPKTCAFPCNLVPMNGDEKKGKPFLDLPQVTLVCITGVNYPASIFALNRSMRKIKFADVLLIGAQRPNKISPGIRFEKAHRTKLDSIDEYSKYCIYSLWRHIRTPHVLIVQADGYVLHPEAWRDNFLEFDYIGAPWRISETSYIDPFNNHIRVGNGGFSLRSKKLLEVASKKDVPWEVNTGDFYKHMNLKLYSEDGNICVHNRHIFEASGCRFAPLEVAIKFSIEQPVAEFEGFETFGFHKSIPNLQIWVREKVAWLVFRLFGRYD